MEREIICTSCPMGCHVTVEFEGDTIISVRGNTCVRGERYAREEMFHPTRTVTTTVALAGGGVLPVKSDAPLAKQKIPEYLKQIQKIVVQPPVRIGDILLEDIGGSGVNIIATQNAF